MTAVRKADDGAFEFLLDGEMVYDLHVSNPGNALRWIEHLADKTWVTKSHLQQFAQLCADSLKVGYL